MADGEFDESKKQRMEEVLVKANEAGFELIDMMYPTVELMGKERVADILQNNNLTMNCLLAMNIVENQGAETEVMAAADFFGCKKVMLVPGRVEGDKDELAERFLQSFADYVKEANKYGITCLIEDDPWIRIPLCTREEMHHYFDELPDLRMVFDTANMMVLNEDPVEYYKEFQPCVQHMHIKDIRYETETPEYVDVSVDGRAMMSCPHFEGLVDFNALFREFAASGYNGTMALEYVPCDEIEFGEYLKHLYKKFSFLQAKYTIGVNQFSLIGELMTNPAKDVWKKVGDMGFHSLEGCVIMDKDPQAREVIRRQEAAMGFPYTDVIAREEGILPFVREVRACGLDMTSMHLFACDAYVGYLTKLVSTIKEISKETGIRQFVVSFMTREMTEAKKQVQDLAYASEELDKAGITLCYHNHDMECRKTEEGSSILEYYMEQCPRLKMQLDIGWSWYADMDTEELIRRYGQRITSLHLKDLTTDARERSDDGRYTAIGYGAVPTAEILALEELCDLTAGKIIIDQDGTDQNMFEELEKGLAFIRKCM